MNYMIMLGQLLLSLSILVAVHEMGHLLAAKYFGMRVEQFSIGFPPKIWSFTKGETEYAISAIPLGGYVKISGMIDESLDTETMKLPPQPWEFRSKPAWQRLIVMLGGIFVNVVIGILIFIGITFVYGDKYLLKDAINNNGGFDVGKVGESIGLKTGDKITKINGKDFKYMEDLINPETLLGDNPTYTVERAGVSAPIEIKLPHDFIQQFNKKETASDFIFYRFTPVVAHIAPGSIAERVKLQPGDQIIEVNGTPVTYYDQIRKSNNRPDSISFKVKRGSEVLSYREAFPAGKLEEGEKETEDEAKVRRIIGFNPAEPKAFLEKADTVITYSFAGSIPRGTERAFTTLVTQVKAFGKIISGKLNPQKSLSGPLGIMRAFGSEWEWERFWSLTGVLSLVLAFMNLLPIPALDGGHVMFLSYEIISGRKPSDKFLETAQKIGMIFLLGLMALIFANDIYNWIVR